MYRKENTRAQSKRYSHLRVHIVPPASGFGRNVGRAIGAAGGAIDDDDGAAAPPPALLVTVDAVDAAGGATDGYELNECADPSELMPAGACE